jgi:hypothetical protein
MTLSIIAFMAANNIEAIYACFRRNSIRTEKIRAPLGAKRQIGADIYSDRGNAQT